MIFITGDIHGEPSRFSVDNFPEQKEMTKNDYVIITGDFGLVWNNSKQEKWWLKWLNKKPFTTLFVDGNHENFDLLNSYPVIDFCGGKAHQISDSIYHLIRGYVFTIEGKKFFCFGGASSHDIQDGILDPAEYSKEEFKKVYKKLQNNYAMFRIKGISWWEEEMPSQEEMIKGISSLDENENKVDFVISHCCPQDVASTMGFSTPDKLTKYFNDLIFNNKIHFKKWYFGHYHVEKQIFGKFVCLYNNIERIS